MRKVLFPFPFYGWGSWSPERLRLLSKETGLICGRARVWAHSLLCSIVHEEKWKDLNKTSKRFPESRKMREELWFSQLWEVIPCYSGEKWSHWRSPGSERTLQTRMMDLSGLEHVKGHLSIMVSGGNSVSFALCLWDGLQDWWSLYM